MSESTNPVAFVAGSTGYVGQAVVAALRAQGITTVAHIRPGSSQLARLQPTFEATGASVDTSAWDVGALSAAFQSHSVTHIFCLIGTTRKQASAEGVEGNIYERIDYGLTAMLAEAATSSQCSPRFIYLSSIGAGVGASSKYLQARGKAEELILSSGLAHIIARPSFITGSDRDESRPAERIGAAVADGALSLAGLLGGRKLKAKYQSTTAPELAKHLVAKALGNEQGIFEGARLNPAN